MTLNDRYKIISSDFSQTDLDNQTGIANGIASLDSEGVHPIAEVNDAVKEVLPSGFPNRTDSTISFDDGSLTFSISPVGDDFYFFAGGTKFTKSSTDSVTITNTEGEWHIYYNESGVLSATQIFSMDIINTYAYVANVYWSVGQAEGFPMGDERHGLVMSPKTHDYLHNTIGTRWESGVAMAVTNTDGTGNINNNAQTSYGAGTIWDEDIKIDIDADPPPGNYRILYKEGASGNWVASPETAFGVLTTGTGRAAFNEWTGTTWQQTEVTNNDFVLAHFFATNDPTEPVVIIQGEADYNTLNLARAGANIEIENIVTNGLSFVEYVTLATVIYQTSNSYTNSVKSRTRTTDTGDDLIDFRNSGFTGGGTGATIADHGSLTGLADDDHPQYTLVTDLAAIGDTGAAGSNLVGFPTIGTPTIDSLGTVTERTISSGVVSGGTISDGGSNTINITGGVGFIKATDSDTAEILSFDWSPSTGNAIPEDSVRYVGVIYNAGTPIIDIRVTNTWDYDTEFPLGTVIRNDSLHILNAPWHVGDLPTNVIERLLSFGSFCRDEFIGGLVLSVTGTRNIAVTAGTLWKHINEYPISAIDTNVSGNFVTEWVDNSGDWTRSTETQYPITQWNDTTQATLQTINQNQYANWWVYIDVGHDTYTLIYPQATYSNSASAESELPPTNLPDHILETGVLAGRILFKEGDDTPVKVEIAWTDGFTPSLAADHGNLAGLSDDDHVQYPLVDGSRDFTGAVGGVDPSASSDLATKNYVDTHFFVSTEQTGTASEQDIAHGLGVTPSSVFVSITDDNSGGGFVITEGVHDGTNVKITATSSVKYKVLAFK